MVVWCLNGLRPKKDGNIATARPETGLPVAMAGIGGAMRELIGLYRQREDGAIGYMLLWFMGVPASLLFFFFLLRGCN
jgi:hypothetical protein